MQKQTRQEQNKVNSIQYTEYYDKNLGKLTTCEKCSQEYELKYFVKNYSFRNVCKNCHALQIKKWRQTKPGLAQKARFRSFRTSADFIKSFKLGKSCTVCNKEYPPCAMDFNHQDKYTKLDSISGLYGKSKKRIRDEIEKCELICANCHRDITQTQLETVPTSKNRIYKPELVDTNISIGSETKFCIKCEQKKHVEDFTLLKIGKRHSYCKKCLREYNKNLQRPDKFSKSERLIILLKDNKTCADCGVQYRYWVMDFDHISDDKFDSINKLRNKNTETVVHEINKCELVCANCHKIRTHRKKLSKDNNGIYCPCIDHGNDSYDLLNFVKSLSTEAKLETINDIQFVTTEQAKVSILKFETNNKNVLKSINDDKAILIFEDEWRENQHKVKNLLINRFKSYQQQKKLRPSQCKIRTINHQDADKFLNIHHYIGACKPHVSYGVFYSDRLICVMSFKTPTRQSSHPWELVRMVSDPEFRVHGIWSKLLQQFIQEKNPDSIVSFSDNRLFPGAVYQAIGFLFDGTIVPDYYWVKNKKRFHKSGLRKSKQEKLSNLTETELREAQGYRKIWDLGKKRWVYRTTK